MSILHRQSQIYINNALKDLNVTSAEYSFILYLYGHDGSTQEEMSEFLFIDKSAATRAISSLENKGFLYRKRHEEDKRYNRVYLSEHALQLEDEIRKRVRSWSDLISDGLDENTVDTVLNALEEMLKNVERKNIIKEMEK